MSNGEYTVETVKIMMVTNIPNKEPIPFTSDVLYHPFLQPNLGKYKLKKYPSVVTEGLLYDTTLLNQLDYSRRVRFFFEPDYMRKKLAELNRNGGMTGKETDKKTDIKVLNIEIMIKLLFQTKFPIIENVGNSYCRNIIKNDPVCNRVGFTAKGTVPQFIIALAPGLFKGLETYFSYLKTDGTVYTITKTIWLNDVINNPLYRGLIDQFNTFRRWREKETKKIRELCVKQEKNIIKEANKQIGVIAIDLLKNLAEQAIALNGYGTGYRRGESISNAQLINFIMEFMTIIIDKLNGIVNDNFKNEMYQQNIKDISLLYDDQEKNAYIKEKLIDIGTRIYGINKILSEIKNKIKIEIETKNPNRDTVRTLVREQKKNEGILSDTNLNYEEADNANYISIYKALSKKQKLPYDLYKNIPNVLKNNTIIENSKKSAAINLTTKDINNLRDIYENLIKNNISISQTFKRVLNSVFEQAKRSDNLQTIRDKYFEQSIKINFEDDEESVRTLLKTNYGEYVKFVENLKKFITPNKESNNEKLQSLIEEYISGGDESNVFTNKISEISQKFLGKHVHKRLDKEKDLSEYVKVDYTTTETITEGEPKTELYLAVDVVKGELTDSNLRKVTCNYRGEELTDRFDHIRKKWAYNPFEIDKKRLFFDFEKVLAAKEPVKKGKGEAGPLPPPPPQKGGPPGIAPPPPPPAILAQGGKKYTRNKKVRRMRNHHITQRMRR
jgi:hypothetical protein